MQEHEYYNLHASANGAAHSARVAANTYALRLMIEHLYFVHKIGVREISHQLRYQQKKVRAVINRAKKDYEAYQSRKNYNEELA